MRDNKLNYVLVGGFVIAMLVALIGSVSLMTGRAGSSDTYHIVLDNVTDIKFGTQVRYEGFPVGQIESIDPFSEGSQMRFRVEVSVREGWRLPTDSVARIGSTSFLAAKTVDIQRGPSTEILKPGDRIPSAAPSDMFTVMAQVAGEVGDLSKHGLKPLLGDLRTMVARFGGNLEVETLKLLRSLNGITAKLDDSSRNLKAIVSKENADTISKMLNEVHKTTKTFAVTSQELKTTLIQVRGLIGQVDKLVQRNGGNIDRSLTDVRYTLGAIARSIDGIMHNMDGTSRNMSEFSRSIRQNPGLLLGGSPPEQISPAATPIQN